MRNFAIHFGSGPATKPRTLFTDLVLAQRSRASSFRFMTEALSYSCIWFQKPAAGTSSNTSRSQERQPYKRSIEVMTSCKIDQWLMRTFLRSLPRSISDSSGPVAVACFASAAYSHHGHSKSSYFAAEAVAPGCILLDDRGW